MPGPAVRVGNAEQHGRRWRVAEIDANGGRSHRYFEGATAERDARLYVEIFRSKTKDRSLGHTVNEYLDHLRRFGGAKRKPLRDSSLAMVKTKLEGIFQLVSTRDRANNRGKRRPEDLPLTDRPLRTLTPELAQRLYSARVNGVSSNGKPISAATHRGELIYASAFGQWCTDQGYLRENPFQRVLPEGELEKGKTQLRIDEARAFAHSAYSDPHPTGGIAAVAVLTMGLRANELLDRTVRDLDDGGRVLWIPYGKTENARRRLAVPPVLRTALLKLCEGQGSDAKIFGTMTDGTLLKHVERLCEVADVPRVCTHGLRGTQVSLTVEVDALVKAASKGAGHGDTGVTRAHYLAAGVEQSARAKLMEEILLAARDDEAEAAALEAAEAEAREAQRKLDELRSKRVAKVNVPLGTRIEVEYPTGQTPESRN